MKKHILMSVAVMLMAGGAYAECIIPEPANFASRTHCPDEVKEYLARVGGCWNAGDEKTQSPERRVEIQSTLCDLRCGQLVKDRQSLEAKYAQSPDTLSVMSEFFANRQLEDYNTLNCKRVLKQR